MTTKKLIPMHQFILEIDALTTKEFCDKFSCPHPKIIPGNIEKTADQFLQVDAIKHRIFVAYAKFLNTPLKKEMFSSNEKDDPLFLVREGQYYDEFSEMFIGSITLVDVIKIADLLCKSTEFNYNANHQFVQHFSH